jgi:hypothetical protein
MVTRAQISLVKCRNRIQCCNMYKIIIETQITASVFVRYAIVCVGSLRK